MKQVIFFVFFIIVLVTQTVKAQTPAQSAAILEASTQQPSFLLFSARSPSLAPLSPGHAFVSFGHADTLFQAQLTSTFGFYPCEDCGMMNDKRLGRVVQGFVKNRNHKPLAWLAVMADSQYASITDSVIHKWDTVRYNLLRRNCVKFVSEVAAAQGLVTPKTTRFGFIPKLPQTYLRQLEAANPGRVINLQGIDTSGFPYLLDENQNGLPDTDEEALSGQ